MQRAVTAFFVAGLLLTGCGPAGPGEPWEVSSSLPMVLTAMHHHADGSVTIFRDANASFRCIEFDTYIDAYGTTRSCLHYVLVSDRGLVLDFLREHRLNRRTILEADAGDVSLKFRGVKGSGWVIATRAEAVGYDDYFGGEYYVDVAGEFEAVFGDEAFVSGLFYAKGDP